MASAGAGGSLPPNFFLTPQQQSLLFAALNSNKSQQSSNNGLSLSPTSFQASPVQTNDGSAFQDTPLFDNVHYDDFGDSSFDFSLVEDQSQMMGDVSDKAGSDDSTEVEGNEKRSHPDDEDDERSDNKRRESTDKVPKKPGRKPLTSEPSSKRKAQNRAAQRAFRERKEKHLKDLETKVDELQKASDMANNENSKLKEQVERMTAELNQYKQRLASMTNPKAAPQKVPFGNASISNLNDVNFQFNFPKFGQLPGPNNNNNNKPKSNSQSFSPRQQTQGVSPPKSQSPDTRSPSVNGISPDSHFKNDFTNFTGIFTPSMASSVTNGSSASGDSMSAHYNMTGNTSSPSASSHSNSNGGPSSSCGTSPEPFTQSPVGTKPLDTMTTIGEEQPSMTSNQPFGQFANLDFSNTNLDWLAGQNASFDPQLFGDWRESQDSVLANPSFDDLFNDVAENDFYFPFNAAPGASNNNAPKKNLLDQIDAQKDNIDDLPPPAMQKNMNCNQIWDKLQNCPKAQNGDFDLDGLCTELTKKAKCSGNGPVVGEGDFDAILKKYMGKDASADCVANSLGIEVKKAEKPNGVGMA